MVFFVNVLAVHAERSFDEGIGAGGAMCLPSSSGGISIMGGGGAQGQQHFRGQKSSPLDV